MEVTYLEFSDLGKKSHKFYEITVNGSELSIRFGPIGQTGQTQIKTYKTPEEAEKQKNKKIQEKLHKGYQISTQNITSISTQNIQQATPTTPLAKAPLLWKFDSGYQAFSLFVDTEHCWLGNQKGSVFKLSHQGEILHHFHLPTGVKCLVSDDIWLYAGCDQGKVYDLSGKIPYLAYEIPERIDIYWLDINDGILLVSDANGELSKINPNGETEWTRLSQGKQGWMVRSDATGIYHGHQAGITKYDFATGMQIWHQVTEGMVLFGWLEDNAIYAGTSGKKIIRLNQQGEIQSIYPCNASVYSCAASPNGKYIFAGDSSAAIYCFNTQGERIWKLKTGCGSALAMQFLHNHLYLVTTEGVFACLDTRKEAIESAMGGQLPETKTLQTHQAVTSSIPSSILEITQDNREGVVLECFEQGNELRVRVISPGYHSDWFVQFPRNIRQKGVRYWVQGVKESAMGKFYRAYGDIKEFNG